MSNQISIKYQIGAVDTNLHLVKEKTESVQNILYQILDKDESDIQTSITDSQCCKATKQINECVAYLKVSRHCLDLCEKMLQIYVPNHNQSTAKQKDEYTVRVPGL